MASRTVHWLRDWSFHVNETACGIPKGNKGWDYRANSWIGAVNCKRCLACHRKREAAEKRRRAESVGA